MFLSACLHGMIVAFFLLWGHGEADTKKPIISPERVVKTKLVRLGKSRPKHLLPRLYNKPKPPAPKTIHLGKKATAKPDKKKKKRPDKKKKRAKKQPKRSPSQRVETPEERRLRMMAAIASVEEDPRRFKEDLEPEGREDGSIYGNAADGRLKATYGDQVTALLTSAVGFSNMIAKEELAKLSAKVYLKVDATGKIVAHRLVKKSGHERFDEAVVRAVSTFSEKGSRRLPRFPEGSSFGPRVGMTVIFDPEE